jgi:hypothetical protein
MTPAPCSRLFEAEAMRDGRLAGAELASFERHMTVCPECSREARALERLVGALRAGSQGSGGADELHVRRERTRLLAAFDRALVPPERQWGARRLLLLPAAALALAFGLLVLWRARPALLAARASSAVVRADSTAVWSSRREGDRERITVERGALWIHVEHAPGVSGRLLVALPDGELEDTGTTFTVSAEGGHTARVAVQEGSVVLRLRGQPPVVVAAGDTWSPAVRPAVSVCASAAPSATPEMAERLSLGASSPIAPPRAPAPSASALGPEASADFRAALARLDRGDDTEAAAAFASFLLKHPRDPRAEDAAYLRVIALQRSGDDGRMNEAARDYLRRYPGGFRHAEMEALSR